MTFQPFSEDEVQMHLAEIEKVLRNWQEGPEQRTYWHEVTLPNGDIIRVSASVYGLSGEGIRAAGAFFKTTIGGLPVLISPPTATTMAANEEFPFTVIRGSQPGDSVRSISDPRPFPVGSVVPVSPPVPTAPSLIPLAVPPAPIPVMPSNGTSKLVLWPPARDYEADRNVGKKRERDFGWIVLIPLILLLLLTGVGLTWPKAPPATAVSIPPVTDLWQLPPHRHYYPPTQTSSWSCKNSEDVRNGRDAGGKVPVDMGTKHAREDQADNCELFFGSDMYPFVAIKGWLIEEQRDGSVYIWPGDGKTKVYPSKDQIVFVEFYENDGAARLHEDDAANDWLVELGIPKSMIHIAI